MKKCSKCGKPMSKCTCKAKASLMGHMSKRGQVGAPGKTTTTEPMSGSSWKSFIKNKATL